MSSENTTGGDSTDTRQECLVCGEPFPPAGIGGHITQSHHDREVRQAALDHLRNVADELGRTPTRGDISEMDGPSPGVYNTRFGGFGAALEAAGFEPNREFSPPKGPEQFLNDVERVANEVGRRPRVEDYQKYGEYTVKWAQKLFGGWLDALDAAVVPSPTRALDKDPSTFLTELRELGDELGRPPTAQEAPHSKGTYARRWGSFTETLRAAGFDANQYRGPEFTPRGSDHPGWKPDSELSHYGECWTAKKRAKIRERDGYECQRCGEDQDDHLEKRGVKLHVHHIVQVEEAAPEIKNSSRNLITLCAECHGKIETGDEPCPEP